MRSEASGWRWLPIGVIADVVGGGTPSTKEASNFGGEIPWLTPKDLSDWQSRWIGGGKRSITGQGLLRSGARMLPVNTVLVSSRAPIGYVALARRELATSQGFRSLVLKQGYVPEFYYYVLRSMTGALEGVASGSTFKEISGAVLKTLEVPVPPPEHQTRVAEVLGSLDDKIESNGRLVRLLERLVEMEFAARFMLSSRPAGRGEVWPTASLGDLGAIRGGGTPSTSVSEYWVNGEIVWLTPKDMTTLRAPVVFDSARKITAAGLESSSAKLLPAGTVLYTSRATLGLTAIARVPMATNQGFIAVEPGPGLSAEFVLMTLRAHAREIAARANGSTFMEVNKTNFQRVPLALPPASERAAFDELASPVFRWIEMLCRETATLTKIRESATPRLISGMLRSL